MVTDLRARTGSDPGVLGSDDLTRGTHLACLKHGNNELKPNDDNLLLRADKDIIATRTLNDNVVIQWNAKVVNPYPREPAYQIVAGIRVPRLATNLIGACSFLLLASCCDWACCALNTRQNSAYVINGCS